MAEGNQPLYLTGKGVDLLPWNNYDQGYVTLTNDMPLNVLLYIRCGVSGAFSWFAMARGFGEGGEVTIYGNKDTSFRIDFVDKNTVKYYTNGTEKLRNIIAYPGIRFA